MLAFFCWTFLFIAFSCAAPAAQREKESSPLFPFPANNFESG